MIRRRLACLALLAFVASCQVPIPNPPSLNPPAPTPLHAHALVAHVFDGDPSADQKIADARVTVDTATGGLTDTAGNVAMGPFPEGPHTVCVQAEGFHQACVDIALTANNQDVNVSLQSALPDPPTRDEMLAVKLSFQGLTVQTQQFGSLPWFEAALPWLSSADRRAAYAAKHASNAWPGGDTHALIFLPSGPALYDEPGQPYSADRFGPLDWTNGETLVDNRLPDLVTEVLLAGFNRVLLFLGGDNGHAGYLVAQKQLPLVVAALEHSNVGDLTPYVCVVPGFDGVWHRPDGNGTGWSRNDIIAFGQQFRSLLPNGCLALEHATGYIPIGEGDGDYNPGGGLTTYDLILSEFDGPHDSAWRRSEQPDSTPTRRDYYGDQIWQIAARLLVTWKRPSDEPADADSAKPPYVMHAGNPRGPYVNCAFEWVGEYDFVRGHESAAQVAADRDYFKSIGYGCGG